MPYTEAERELLNSLIEQYGEAKGRKMYYKIIMSGKMGAESKRRNVEDMRKARE
jgi:hypothetical protein